MDAILEVFSSNGRYLRRRSTILLPVEENVPMKVENDVVERKRGAPGQNICSSVTVFEGMAGISA